MNSAIIMTSDNNQSISTGTIILADLGASIVLASLITPWRMARATIGVALFVPPAVVIAVWLVAPDAFNRLRLIEEYAARRAHQFATGTAGLARRL